MSVEKPNPYNSFVSTTLENGDVKIFHKSKEEEEYIKKHFVQKKDNEMDEQDELDEEDEPAELNKEEEAFNRTDYLENSQEGINIKPKIKGEKSWTVESVGEGKSEKSRNEPKQGFVDIIEKINK